jgi:hypothetical protein
MNRRLVALGAAVTLLAASPASAAGLKFSARLSGAQEAPAVVTTASGKVSAKFDDALTQVEVKVTLSDIVNVTAAHFHCGRAGEEGAVAFGLIMPGPCALVGQTIACTLTNADLAANDCNLTLEDGRPINNIASLAFAMRDGLIYANIHTMANTGGEIRGQMIGK